MEQTIGRAHTSLPGGMGLASLQAEPSDKVELEMEGAVPVSLESTSHRIGPALHDVYGERYRLRFDRRTWSTCCVRPEARLRRPRQCPVSFRGEVRT
jgi:hypothetical protein